MPLVSVAIRAFRRRWLGDAIASVLAQTHRDLELVVYDDAGDLEEVTSAAADARIRYVRASARHGASGRFDAAVRLCRGDFIALLDDDDYYAPGFVERLLAALQAEPGAGIACCRVRFDVGGTLTAPVDRRPAGVMRDSARRMLAERWTVPSSQMLMRRTALDEAWRDQPMPDGVAPDMFVNLRVALAGWWHVLVDEPLVSCRWHAEQLSRTRAALDLPIATWQVLRLEDATLSVLRDRNVARAHLARAVNALCEGRPGEARDELRGAGLSDPAAWALGRRALAVAARAGVPGALAVRLCMALAPRGVHRPGPAPFFGDIPAR